MSSGFKLSSKYVDVTVRNFPDEDAAEVREAISDVVEALNEGVSRMEKEGGL